MPDLSGQNFGRYHILKALGEGGTARVYKAYDTHLEKDVALKAILPGFQRANDAWDFFEKEVEILKMLEHPNIIKILDSGKNKNIYYIVLDYIPGRTLKKFYDNSLPWKQAVLLLIPVAKALAYAHSKQVIHRDVKPGNILLSTKGVPYLTDFGIARLVAQEHKAGNPMVNIGMGTPEYMAPELLKGGQADERSDIYSLGIILYELISGRQPYRADTPLAVALKQINDPLPAIRNFAEDYPLPFQKFLLKCLAKNPQDRFASMQQVVEIMEKLKELKDLAPRPAAAIQNGQPAISRPLWTSSGQRENKGPETQKLKEAGWPTHYWLIVSILSTFVVIGAALTFLMWMLRL